MQRLLLVLPLMLVAAGYANNPAEAQPYYGPGYYAPGYYPPGYYRPPPPPPPPPVYYQQPGYAQPYYTAPPAYNSANCGTPDQFKPCYR
jgi:hypothetical protein